MGDAVIRTKESLAKVDADYQTTERSLDKARMEQGSYDRVLKMAADKIARERSEKVDAKNKWVKDMVNYAQKEKGMKSVGADATEKHFKSLKHKNDQKELGHKSEVQVKTEKTTKAEEVKDKAAKRVEQ